MEYEYSKEPKWYVLHTYSGYENVAKENLENVIEKFGLQDRIFDIVIPEEDVIEEKNGKKKLVTRKSMPTYILIKMIYGDDLWQKKKKRTRGVTGFVGPKGRPLALPDEEVMRLRLEKIKVETDIEVGDTVEIIEGPLDKMVGKVVAVNPDNNQLTVSVEMFGRENNVELTFEQVHKVQK